MNPAPVNKTFEFHCNSRHGFLLTLLRKLERKVNSIILSKRQKQFKDKRRYDGKIIRFVLFLFLIR